MSYMEKKSRRIGFRAEPELLARIDSEVDRRGGPTEKRGSAKGYSEICREGVEALLARGEGRSPVRRSETPERPAAIERLARAAERMTPDDQRLLLKIGALILAARTGTEAGTSEETDMPRTATAGRRRVRVAAGRGR